MRARPLVTYALIAVNVAVYAVCYAQAGTGNFYDSIDSPVFENSILRPGLVADGEYWRLLTSGFLHLSVTHIAVNMISLFILGRLIEPILGPGRFLLIYLASLFGGSAAVVAVTSASQGTAGASGAIYGLMGAMLVIVLKLKAPPGQVVAIIAINLVFSFSVPGISLVGHLGGLVFGIIATVVALYAPQAVMRFAGGTPTPELRRRATTWGWIGLCAVLAVAIVLGVVLPSARGL